MFAMITGNLWRAACVALGSLLVALIGFVVALLIQIHGLPFVGGGLIARLDRMTDLRKAEAANHRQTKTNFRQAMAEAKRMELARIARVKAENERINAYAKDDFQRRAAALRARFDSLRSQARARAESAGGAVSVPGLPTPLFGFDEAASEDGFPNSERLECSLNSTQLDALITNIESLTAIDPNKEN